MSTTYPNSTHASENFTWRELSCGCGCVMPATVRARLVLLAPKLQALRVRLGVPLHVNSAHRCPPYNKRIGGAPRSQHMYGNAVDLSSSKVTPAKVLEAARQIKGLNGIGIYPTFTHVDQRVVPAFWDER